MRLEWIEDILAIHDLGSLRAAAEVRFLTASAFTRRIKAVEESIGGDLLDRSNKPVTLRPHVEELIPRMREVAAHLRTVQDELSGLGENIQISRLICQHTLSVSWAPKVTKTLSLSGARVRVRSGSKDDCLLSVLKGEVDIALVYEDPNVRINAESDLFEQIQFGLDEFLPVAAIRDNTDLLQKIDTQKLPIVTYPRNIFLGEVLEKTLAKSHEKGVSFSTVAESGLGPAVLEFVREGLGVGWLPHSLVEEELRSGEFTSMVDIVPSFHLNVVAIKSKSSRSKRVLQNWKDVQERFERPVVQDTFS
jgi:DNA-binding transcriptional LysR family regulator